MTIIAEELWGQIHVRDLIWNQIQIHWWPGICCVYIFFIRLEGKIDSRGSEEHLRNCIYLRLGVEANKHILYHHLYFTEVAIYCVWTTKHNGWTYCYTHLIVTVKYCSYAHWHQLLQHNKTAEDWAGHMTIFFSSCCRKLAKAALLTGSLAESGLPTKDVFHPQWLRRYLQEAATFPYLAPDKALCHSTVYCYQRLLPSRMESCLRCSALSPANGILIHTIFTSSFRTWDGENEEFCSNAAALLWQYSKN